MQNKNFFTKANPSKGKKCRKRKERNWLESVCKSYGS